MTATARAEDLNAALRCFLDPDTVADFPAWETLPERLSRAVTPSASASPSCAACATPIPTTRPTAPSTSSSRRCAILQPVVKGLGDLRPVSLRAGEEAPLEQVVADLAAAAMPAPTSARRRGEFAVRGGILDVFPPTEDHPVRVEFWGDTIEEIRWFKVADQRSLEVAEHGLWAPPCQELLLTDVVRERAAALVDQLPGAADLLGKLAEGIAVEGMESLAPALVDGMESVLDTLREGTTVVVCDPERVRTRAHDLAATSQEFLDAGWANAAGNAVPIDLQGVLGTASLGPGRPARPTPARRACPGGTSTPSPPTPSSPTTPPPCSTPASRAPATAAAPPRRSRTCAAGWPRAGGSWSSRGHGLAKRVHEVLADEEVPGASTPTSPTLRRGWCS